MTKEQKIELLTNATDEEILEQFETSVKWLGKGTIEEQVERQEDYKLVKNELRKRLIK